MTSIKGKFFEDLICLYLRLNGYFSEGFIIHASEGNLSETDILACRFPKHSEPEREISPCTRLNIPSNAIDLIIGEAKTNPNPEFNASIRDNIDGIQSVIRRIGAFADEQIGEISCAVQEEMKPEKLQLRDDFPTFNTGGIAGTGTARICLRLVLFSASDRPIEEDSGPCIYGDDIMTYIWNCYRPAIRRRSCAERYDFNLWGERFTPIVRYFKDQDREECGTFEDLFASIHPAQNQDQAA